MSASKSVRLSYYTYSTFNLVKFNEEELTQWKFNYRIREPTTWQIYPWGQGLKPACMAMASVG